MLLLSNRLSLAFVLLWIPLVASPVLAWDIAIGTNFLDTSLYVGSGSGPLPTWTTLDERVRASDVPGPTVPAIWVTQTWDPIAGEWPAEFIETSEGATQASIYNDDVAAEFWGSAEAFVFGSIPSGDAAGAAVGYDFEFTLAPFSTATIVLDEFETYVYMESAPGDVGTGFAQAKLFRTDVGLDDPGGANMPLAADLYSLQAGDPIIDTQPSFSSPFTNSTSSPVTIPLRFEASVSVFAVPEPGFGMSLVVCTGAMAAIGRGRRRSRGQKRSKGTTTARPSSSPACKAR